MHNIGMADALSPPAEITPDDLEVLAGRLYQVKEWNDQANRAERDVDGLLKFVWREQEASFFYEYKPDWSEKTFRAALDGLLSLQSHWPDAQPLLILPFLREEQLLTLAEEGISGLDLSGNASLHFGRNLLLITGRPARYRRQQTIKNPFVGRSSLVARMLLIQRTFKTGLELKKAIEERGGEISQPLVSRVLQELTREALIAPDGKGHRIRVTDPARLLDLLAAQWRDEAKLLWRGRASEQAQGKVLPTLFHTRNQPMTITGLASVDQQTSLTTNGNVALYVEKLGTLPDTVGGIKTTRFPNLSFYRPAGPEVYFDSRETPEGIRYASPVQTYLECMNGDARLEQAAAELRQQILNHLGEKS